MADATVNSRSIPVSGLKIIVDKTEDAPPSSNSEYQFHDVTDRILKVLLDDWLFGYGSQYTLNDYEVLRTKIYDLVSQSKTLTFLVPGFPAKCPNTDRKVMGKLPDLAEFIALRTAQKTLRNLESFYKPGVDFIVMSDYHTFDQYIGVNEEDYNNYHKTLKNLIEEAGCSDIIRVISLGDFPEFQGVPSNKISSKLNEDYGGILAFETFDKKLSSDPVMLEQYTQLKKFMTFEQSKSPDISPAPSPPRSPELPRKMGFKGFPSAMTPPRSPDPLRRRALLSKSPAHTPPMSPDMLVSSSPSNNVFFTDSPTFLTPYRSLDVSPCESPNPSPPSSPRPCRKANCSGVKAQRRHIKNVTRGMMVQGKALDVFMKLQTYVKDYIRLSIHPHHPSKGKFSIDLFKGMETYEGVLRTAWHHAVIFDTKVGRFTVSHRERIESEKVENSCLICVTYNDENWFYIRLYFVDGFNVKNELSACIQASMIRGSCGIMLEVLHDGAHPAICASSIHDDSLSSLIREFGVVILRGFQEFSAEEDMINFYCRRAPDGFVEWSFGPLKKVNPNSNQPGFVNSNFYLPVHFDLSMPPAYLGCNQSDYGYADYVPREFVLYCKTATEESTDAGNGATTFIDAKAVPMSMHGTKKEEWKSVILEYETELREKGDKDVYFGGKGNAYEYPLIMKCPWTGHDVLRYGETVSAAQCPTTDQQLWFHIKSTPSKNALEPDALEEDIKRIAFKKNVFFEHCYNQGDQVYVNNYTMLHGRNGFASNRELWRVQALPPSKNILQSFPARKEVRSSVLNTFKATWLTQCKEKIVVTNMIRTRQTNHNL